MFIKTQGTVAHQITTQYPRRITKIEPDATKMIKVTNCGYLALMSNSFVNMSTSLRLPAFLA